MPVAKRRSATPETDDGAGAKDDGWEEGTYVWYDGPFVHQYSARWNGAVCVYKSEDGRWAVCTRGQVQVTKVKTEADARSVAEIVAATFTVQQLKLPYEVLKVACPPWFVAWGAAVNRAGKFVDPTPYLDGAYP